MKPEAKWTKFRLEKILKPAQKIKRIKTKANSAFTQRRLLAAKSRFGQLAHKHRFLVLERGKPDIHLKDSTKIRGIKEITLYYEDCNERLETEISIHAATR
ncbi:hypothetical protein ACQKPX_10735 [Photobacterium sp. DNB23_23_1]|uniref:Uncharacterized protein n=1 Tax=Photobacterium pectinilyticum TaxID=2906793 RepID=A0ABT1N4I5_9GAMM|nr:hypothetical protein [Photobacterium sp. ZSDE20]MCQ1059620.1 hypothetical protein [Photobacterium sp. ZSDE20]MDD1827624.1 hypothetical protein [Photobacterium sp. ZSDE20]